MLKNIQKFYRQMPSSKRTFLLIVIVVTAYLFMTKKLTSDLMVILGIGTVLIIGIAPAEVEPDIIPLEEAKEEALIYVWSKKKTGIIESGTISEVYDGTLRFRDGKPWYYEVACTTSDPKEPFYIVKVLPYIKDNRKIIGAKFSSAWSAEDAPDIEYIMPPNAVQWLQRKKEAETKLDELSK